MREERERDLLVEAEPAPLFSNADSFRSIHFYKNSVPAPSRLARQDTVQCVCKRDLPGPNDLKAAGASATGTSAVTRRRAGPELYQTHLLAVAHPLRVHALPRHAPAPPSHYLHGRGRNHSRDPAPFSAAACSAALWACSPRLWAKRRGLVWQFLRRAHALLTCPEMSRNCLPSTCHPAMTCPAQTLLPRATAASPCSGCGSGLPVGHQCVRGTGSLLWHAPAPTRASASTGFWCACPPTPSTA